MTLEEWIHVTATTGAVDIFVSTEINVLSIEPHHRGHAHRRAPAVRSTMKQAAENLYADYVPSDVLETMSESVSKIFFPIHLIIVCMSEERMSKTLI